jgi:hypothetical protein
MRRDMDLIREGTDSVDAESQSSLSVRSSETDTPPCRDPRFAVLKGTPPVELARCFLRLANLSNFALDRLSRYEATLWRQVSQTLFALGALDRREPQEQGGRFRGGKRQKSLTYAHDEE